MPTEPDADATEFRWSLVAAADRDWLRGRTLDIIGLAYRGACDAVRIGVALNEAKARLRHGAYEAWVEGELPFSLSTAKRYRQVADAFAEFQKAQFGLFDESALYVLAERGAPQAARAHAAELARSGRRVTHSLALEILDAARPGAEPTAPEVRAYERDTRHLALNETAAAPDDSPAARSWRLFAELVGAAKVVHVSKVDDPEDDTLYSVTVHRELDLPVVAVRRSLADAIAAAAGREPIKHCPGCKAEKPVGEFGFDASNDDGRNRYCKACERARRAENRRAKKGRKRGAGPAA